MAKKLGKNVSDLVVSRSEEYREILEEYELIKKATPLYQKHGNEYWMMSLRNLGVRFVSVGNIFSGLFCPVREERLVKPQVVRKPYLQAPDQPRKNALQSKSMLAKKKKLKKRMNEIKPHKLTQKLAQHLTVQGIITFTLFFEGTCDRAKRGHTSLHTRTFFFTIYIYIYSFTHLLIY